VRKGWTTKKLGEIIRLEYGKPLADFDRNPNGLYPAYGANGVKDRTDKFYKNVASIIVGRKGSAGEVTLTEDRYWPLDVTFFVEFDRAKYELQYLYFLLLTLNLSSMAKGVKPGINRNDIYDITVTTTDIEEQRRIVTLLDEAFANIATAKANAEKNLKNARELLGTQLQVVFAEPSKDWLKTTIGEHIRFIDYRGKTPLKTSQGLRLITAKNVKMGFIQTNPEEFVAPDSYYSWMTRGIPNKGDVLFTTEAPLANVAQLDTDEKVVFAQRIIIMQPNRQKLDPTFLKFLLLSPTIQQRIKEQGTGATVQGIKASLLKKIEISFPADINLQASIVEQLESLSEEVDRLEFIYRQKLTALDDLKKSLLHQAFSGQL
jgi:type I restriction enzyme, S subunit